MQGRGYSFLTSWFKKNLAFPVNAQADWVVSRISRSSVVHLLNYALFVFVPPFKATSVFGFALLINMITQFFSGFLLSLFYVPDPSFVLTFREEYVREVWWYFVAYKLHVVGVDTIFVFSYLHLLKKIFIKNFIETDLDGWFTGTYAFLIFHAVVFLGITLSTNHLGEVTITIASNIYWSLLLRWHKSYTIFFSNKHLNVDQLTRFMIAHYLISLYYTYLLQLHVMYIHESWDAESAQSSQQDYILPKMSWLWDSLPKEAATMFTAYTVLMTWFIYLAYPDLCTVNYTFFEQWSEAEVEELNFFIVAPHWYFRPHMGLLTVCAQHYEGLFWFAAYYLLLCFLPAIYRLINSDKFGALRGDYIPMRQSRLQQTAYIIFLGSMLYCGGTLPCGRFYYEAVEGFFGNIFLKLSYQYIYIYLGFIVHAIDVVERSALSLPFLKTAA
jgi:ubiquinol-cytochrome c reductase cytochrome b/c1 subunit